MNTNKELKWNQLKSSFSPSDFPFTSTTEIESSEEVIGQEYALSSLVRGLKIEATGYNIYICGASDTNKEKVILEEINTAAKDKEIAYSLGYIHNFEVPEVPVLLELLPSDATTLKADMEEFVAFIVNELPSKLEAASIQKRKKYLLNELESFKEKQVLILEQTAKEKKIQMKLTETSIGFSPINDKGKTLTKKEYNELTPEDKKKIEQDLSELYALAEEMTEGITEAEKKYEQGLEDILVEIVLEEIGSLIKFLHEKYNEYPKLTKFFNQIAEHILSHLDAFVNGQSSENKELRELLPWLESHQVESLVKNYYFNLLVDNEALECAPVIVDTAYPILNLGGKVLLEAEQNVLRSDYSHIRAGLMHYANKGYLVLHMKQLLDQTEGWTVLKRMLITNHIYLQGNEELGVSLATPIKPEPVETVIKVILFGSNELYNLLYELDEDFKRLFKVKINFEESIKSDVAHAIKLAKRIKGMCEKEKLPPVTVEGLIKLIDYGNRLMSTPNKLPGNLEPLFDVIREASLYSNGHIEASQINRALKERSGASTRLEQEIDEKIMDDTYLIDTIGEKIGQVNGLAIYSVEDISFGKPIKITATTYRGKEGIVNIEKEAELSGSIHTKGIHIINGFLGYQFAQDIPLSLCCNVCFEQNYGPIDGDSASSAELYAILSSLAEVPLKQYIATTGSVNQFGEIQPIGGVNEKIEGFYKICKKRGLRGEEGVIIPKQNVKELILEDEIIESVKKRHFHIYGIGDIWEGIEIMTSKSREEITVKVKNKLRKYSGYLKNNL